MKTTTWRKPNFFFIIWYSRHYFTWANRGDCKKSACDQGSSNSCHLGSFVWQRLFKQPLHFTFSTKTTTWRINKRLNTILPGRNVATAKSQIVTRVRPIAATWDPLRDRSYSNSLYIYLYRRKLQYDKNPIFYFIIWYSKHHFTWANRGDFKKSACDQGSSNSCHLGSLAWQKLLKSSGSVRNHISSLSGYTCLSVRCLYTVNKI